MLIFFLDDAGPWLSTLQLTLLSAAVPIEVGYGRGATALVFGSCKQRLKRHTHEAGESHKANGELWRDLSL